MKILFVAMPFSIHTARWIKQLENSGHEIYFFSSFPYAAIHPDLTGVNYYEYYHALLDKINYKIIYHPVKWFEINFKFKIAKKIYGKLFRFLKLEKSREQTLALIIKKINPDIIHSLETQHAGYQVAEVKKKWKGIFPVWIHSNWGIDLHFFGQFEKHIPLIKQTLSLVDIFITEGKRDEVLARNYGFTGTMYTFPSVGGGFVMPPISKSIPSERKKILVKGMHNIGRRGLVAIRALERCIDILTDYEIILYSSNEVTQTAVELLYYRTGKKIIILNEVSQQKMLQLNAESRLSISINLTDGVPNSMLEAMLMGAFPIQSNTSMADEWIVHKKTGMIVPPEDPDVIEIAIRKALQDDEMVNGAAPVNRRVIEERLDYRKNRTAAIQMYNEALNKG